MEKNFLIPLPVNGKFNKKDIRYFVKRPWGLRSFLFSQAVSFRLRDKALMKRAFKLWFDDVIKRYGKSKWIECIIFCRKEE